MKEAIVTSADPLAARVHALIAQLPRWSVRYGGCQLPPCEVADPKGLYVHVGDVYCSVAAALAYVQHKPECPRSLPNLVLDLGPGWTQSVSFTEPCNCGLEAALAAALAPNSEKE